jgi:hypothetical protein
MMEDAHLDEGAVPVAAGCYFFGVFGFARLKTRKLDWNQATHASEFVYMRHALPQASSPASLLCPVVFAFLFFFMVLFSVLLWLAVMPAQPAL